MGWLLIESTNLKTDSSSLKTKTMSNVLFAIVLMFSTPILEATIENPVAIVPKVMDAPKMSISVDPKRGKGKGRGKTPYFAKYFK
jgi:hypothetical protein